MPCARRCARRTTRARSDAGAAPPSSGATPTFQRAGALHRGRAGPSPPAPPALRDWPSRAARLKVLATPVVPRGPGGAVDEPRTFNAEEDPIFKARGCCPWPRPSMASRSRGKRIGVLLAAYDWEQLGEVVEPALARARAGARSRASPWRCAGRTSTLLFNSKAGGPQAGRHGRADRRGGINGPESRDVGDGWRFVASVDPAEAYRLLTQVDVLGNRAGGAVRGGWPCWRLLPAGPAHHPAPDLPECRWWAASSRRGTSACSFEAEPPEGRGGRAGRTPSRRWWTNLRGTTTGLQQRHAACSATPWPSWTQRQPAAGAEHRPPGRRAPADAGDGAGDQADLAGGLGEGGRGAERGRARRGGGPPGRGRPRREPGRLRGAARAGGRRWPSASPSSTSAASRLAELPRR